jgi:mRNA-degrading endonuclease RelE of RelBE toxin-antitoxin system
MTIHQSPTFLECIKKLTKPKYAGVYGSLITEINNFFKEYDTFEKVWQKSYLLFENSNIRVNKIRLENKLQNSGKSGGYRMIAICDRRSESVCLLFVYPKIGPHGMESTNLDFSKKLVKSYAQFKKDDKNIEFKLISI